MGAKSHPGRDLAEDRGLCIGQMAKAVALDPAVAIEIVERGWLGKGLRGLGLSCSAA
jgi:hypothetical protein